MKFLHHLRACIVEYVSEYIFFVSNKKTHTQKAKESKENRKTKDTKEEKEKENVVTKICGKTNCIHWYRLTICSVQRKNTC